jgi:hypothetical protein
MGCVYITTTSSMPAGGRFSGSHLIRASSNQVVESRRPQRDGRRSRPAVLLAQTYTLTRIYHLDGHVLRVKVIRDFYEFQSHATVAVLGGERTWTVLASAPPCDWHERTTSQATDARQLVPIADQLARRGLRILAATSPDTNTAS